MGYLESLQLFYTPNNELEKSIKIHQQGFDVTTTTTNYYYDAFGRRIGKSSSTQKSSKLNQRGQLVRFPSNLSSLNTTDRPQRKNTLMLWDGNRQVQECTDEQIFTTVYEQSSLEPVARVVQLASHIEQKRLADIAYETRRFVRIGESEETINQRIADKSQPLINIYHYHCNHLGTPQELSDENGNIIWLSYDRAWGGSFDTIYKQQFIDNWAINESELQPFKFQGQSLDVETGLHYNRFRYYDSDVGMFISRDPIGLLGGLNVFAYAPNPVHWIDPWGLTCTEILNKNFSSRKQALRAIKRDLGIPMSEKPIKVTKDVPLTTRQGKQIMKDGNPVMTREYHYRTPKGETVVIQEHSHGHAFGPVGTEGNQGPHFNPRTLDQSTGNGSRNDSFPGISEHYSWGDPNAVY